MILRGLAVPYRSPAYVDGRRVVFARGACRAALARGRRVPVWLNHDRAVVLAATAAFTETARGLFFGCHVAGDSARVLLASAACGGLAGASVSWSKGTERGAWVDGTFVLLEVEMIELSIIRRPDQPAFRETWVQCVS